ncbi:MAG: PIN domain nuclease [Pasteurellales bacterium]|nr:MAG: PIN domain nuclease [Pasteurellales bacterium]
MNILFDTHILLWISMNEQAKFSQRSLDLINDINNNCYISVATIWEISIKSALGKPNFDVNAKELVKYAQDLGVIILPIKVEHTLGVAKLPLIHGDPFDRLLLVQSKMENLTLMTADDKLLKYDYHGLLDVRKK